MQHGVIAPRDAWYKHAPVDGMHEAPAYEAGLVCPSCHGHLGTSDDGWQCGACGSRFGREGSVPNFVIGQRFPDDDKLALLAYEERANRACARDYYVPVIRSLTTGLPHPRVVSIGCGSGVDVEELAAAGFDAVGLDCGHRNAAWPRRNCADRLLLANGQHSPFADGWFDVAITGCVFPHVGVVGDTHRVASTHRDERLALAQELARLVVPGGHLIVSSPNRTFPFDLFHRHDPNRRIPRRNRTADAFLLSLADYDDLFVRGAGCRRVEALPITGYWGFVNMGATWRTRLLRAALRAWFRAISAVPHLRASRVAPWLCVHVLR